MSTGDAFSGAPEVTPTAGASTKDTIIRLQRVHLAPNQDLVIPQDATMGVPTVTILEVITLGEQIRWTYALTWVKA